MTRTLNPFKLWLKLCHCFNNALQNLFARLGILVATHPLLVIFSCFLIIGVFASGFVFVKFENRIEKLYIPQDSESIEDLRRATRYGFYRPSSLTEVILMNKKDGNVLTKECFQDALRIHKIITNITGYTDLCLPIQFGPGIKPKKVCTTVEPLAIFDYKNAFGDLLLKLNRAKESVRMNYPRIFGKNAKGFVQTAEALRLIYVMKGPNLDEDDSMALSTWEKGFLNEMRSLKDSLRCGPVVYTTGRSMDDAITESLTSDVKLLSITFLVMISFACLMLARYRNVVTGHGLLAVAGVFCVILGIAGAFGLAIYARVPFVSIVGVLPFLIVGIGIDDMFLIVDQLDRTTGDRAEPNQAMSIPDRLSAVMREIGPAVTMTTLTDVIAFAIGTTSLFPSIVYFCTYAALAILFAFLLLVTAFVAVMSYDCSRVDAARRDIFPCIKARTVLLVDAESPAGEIEKPGQAVAISSKIMEKWARLLMKPLSKAIVVILSIGLLVSGVYGSTFINEEFERRNLAKDDSEYVKFLNTFEKYFTEGIPVDLVLESGLDYSDMLTQDKIENLTRIIQNNPHYERKVESWLREFKQWSRRNNIPALGSKNFVPTLKRFLATKPRFWSNILLTKDSSAVKASRLRCFIKQTKSSAFLRDAMTSLRKDLPTYPDLPVFASAYQFIFIEQFVSTLPETIRNLGLAALAIFIVSSLFLRSSLVLVVVLLGFVSLIFELLGLMHIWGVSLNSISMINLVMAIGFAVDYSAHIAHAFVHSRHANPEDKAVDALRTVGASVLMGGFSTFLGMVVTAFASSEIFRIFFKMFFGIVVLGLLHGLCFLPVWLSILTRGRPSTSAAGPTSGDIMIVNPQPVEGTELQTM